MNIYSSLSNTDKRNVTFVVMLCEKSVSLSKIGIDKCNCFMSPQISELKKAKCLTA